MSVLPIGLASQIDRIDCGGPERRLLCEVIHMALRDAQRGDREAQWFFAHPDSAFWIYCAQLGLDPKAIRAQVLYGD